jgi:hypothetical protein
LGERAAGRHLSVGKGKCITTRVEQYSEWHSLDSILFSSKTKYVGGEPVPRMKDGRLWRLGLWP